MKDNEENTMETIDIFEHFRKLAEVDELIIAELDMARSYRYVEPPSGVARSSPDRGDPVADLVCDPRHERLTDAFNRAGVNARKRYFQALADLHELRTARQRWEGEYEDEED